MPNKKEKKVVKTKEELLNELRNNAQFKEKMAFTREKFLPALTEASKSVDDTLTFLGSIETVLMEVFFGLMKERKFGELNLISKLDVKDEKYEQTKAVLEMMNDYTVFEARDILSGMKKEVQLWCNDLIKDMKLEDLPKKWIDQL